MLIAALNTRPSAVPEGRRVVSRGFPGAWLSLYNLPLNTIKGAFLGNSRMTPVAVFHGGCRKHRGAVRGNYPVLELQARELEVKIHRHTQTCIEALGLMLWNVTLTM